MKKALLLLIFSLLLIQFSVAQQYSWIVTSNGNNQGGAAVLHTTDGGEPWEVLPLNCSKEIYQSKFLI